MERTELMELAKRMLAHVENGTTDQTDDLMEVPVSEYVDPDRWAAEMEVIFKRVPLALGADAASSASPARTRPSTCSACRC